MTYRTWSNIKVWLTYFVVFYALALALNAARGWWTGQPIFSLWNAALSAILPVVLATGVTFRWGRRP